MEGFPRRFGGYVLVKPLARGGMGALYLALHGQRGMEKLCVVKTALPHLIEKGYLQRFKDEAKVVVRLTHGNLVGVFDAGQVKGEIFLAMEFVEGKDLRAVWNRCAQKGIAFPLPVAVHIVKELVRGLGYAHTFEGLRLVHRDVSPPNALLSYSGEVKLTDFGLATSTLKLEKTAPGVVYGKVSYMSPEQARGEALDGRTDLYAAGIILWELLTGRQLFAQSPKPQADESQDDLLERVRHPVIVPPSQRAGRVPRDLDAIVMKALAPKPEDRFQTGEEMRSELASFLAKNAPAMDGHQVARFLRELFSDIIIKERSERDGLLRGASALLESLSNNDIPQFHEESSKGDNGHVPTAAMGRREAKTPVDTGKPLEEGSRMVGALLAGRYQIKRLCGEGGMGRVYEAEHIEIGKRVAIKVLHPAYSRTPDLVERFRREARAASRIEHPNIVNVTDFGTTADGSLFFVMEYIEGIELGLLIHREGPLPPVRALRIAEQMCEALQAAHNVGVIHRDLKPENILLLGLGGNRSSTSSPGTEPRDPSREPSDFVKVLDFGIAKSAGIEESSAKQGRKLTRPGVAMGTPEYMAPEQAAGYPADPRSDIYGVGSILYEMLAGIPPYEGDNVMEVLHKKANDAPAPLIDLRPGLSADIVALVERAMARNPDDRPKSMGDLAYQIHLVETALVATPGPQVIAGSTDRSGAHSGNSQAFFAEVSSTHIVHPPGGRKRAILVGAGIASALVLGAGIMFVLRPSAATTAVAAKDASMDHAPDLRGEMDTATDLIADTQADPAVEATPDPEPEPEPDTPQPKPRENHRPPPKAPPQVPPPALQALELEQQAAQLLHTQRYGEATDAYRKLLAFKNKRSVALVGLAQIAFQAKNYKEAADRAKEAVKSGGGLDARLLMGDANFKLERFEEAKRAYTEALKIAPNHPVAKQNLQLIEKRAN